MAFFVVKCAANMDILVNHVPKEEPCSTCTCYVKLNPCKITCNVPSNYKAICQPLLLL